MHCTTLFICGIQRRSPSLHRLQKPFFDKLLQRHALLLGARHGFYYVHRKFYSADEGLVPLYRLNIGNLLNLGVVAGIYDDSCR